jgi:hypothetical protein
VAEAGEVIAAVDAAMLADLPYSTLSEAAYTQCDCSVRGRANYDASSVTIRSGGDVTSDAEGRSRDVSSSSRAAKIQSYNVCQLDQSQGAEA